MSPTEVKEEKAQVQAPAAAAVITKDDADKAVAKATAKFDRSREWMQANFWGEWEQVLRQYLCEPAEIINPNDEGATAHSTDTSRYRGLFGANGRMINETVPRTGDEVVNLYVPDQWALVRRKTARVTAQVPNLRMMSRDFVRANKVSRTIMWQWDTMGRAREEKKHTACAFLFGWSVKAWYWERSVYKQTFRVDPFRADEGQWRRIVSAYEGDIRKLLAVGEEISADGLFMALGDEQLRQVIAAELVEKHAIGRYLRVREDKLGYVGPKFDHVFLPYLFPMPNFSSIQDSAWFAVIRRRNRSWFENLAAAYDGEKSFNKEQMDDLLKDVSEGTKASEFLGKEGDNLLGKFTAAVNRTVGENGSGGYSDDDDAEWSVLEIHHKGRDGENATVEYVPEGRYYLGRLPYTFDLEDGRKAFTEKVFVDSFLGGVGDSASRIIRKMVEQHGRETSLRGQLADSVLRPYMRTDDPNLMEEPERIKRGPYGIRLINVQGRLEPVAEPHAHAAIMTGLNNDSAIMRNIQYATGESNMSMQANVDPQQARTATGARIMAFNQDTLSREEQQMHDVSIREDAEMMRQLNRSELSDELTFDMSPYARANADGRAAGAGQGTDPNQPPQPPPTDIGLDPLTTVTPEDFQIDGMMQSEANSTLADDDELNVHKAQVLFDMVMQAPQMFNPKRAADTVLIAMGEGSRLQEWQPVPPTGPVEPEPAQARLNMNLVVNYKDVAELNTDLANQLLGEMLEERQARDGQTGEPVGSKGPGPGPNARMTPPRPGMATRAPGQEGPQSSYEAGVGAPVNGGGK